MDTNEYTRVGFRIGSTNSSFTRYDVGLFLLDKVHYRTAHHIDEPEIYNPNRHKYQVDRPAETDATRFKGVGNKYQNLSKFYY